jgi:hypothetical protein
MGSFFAMSETPQVVRRWAWLLLPTFTALGALLPLVGIVRGPATHAWTAAPFLLLGLFAVLHLRRAPQSLVRGRLTALLSAFIILMLLGWWCHKPAGSPGMNFGVAFFPLYAMLAAPVGYGFGRVAAQTSQGMRVRMRGEHRG